MSEDIVLEVYEDNEIAIELDNPTILIEVAAEMQLDIRTMRTEDYDSNGDGVVDAADTAAHATNADTATHATSADSIPWTGIADKPSDFNPSAHIHPILEITDLSSELSLKELASNKGQVNGYAPLDNNGKVPLANQYAVDSNKTLIVADDAAKAAIDTGTLTVGDRVVVLTATDGSREGWIWDGIQYHQDSDTDWANISLDWANIANKPTVFDPSTHNHPQSESHSSADTDTSVSAIHHTLGTGENQASPGNHSHSGPANEATLAKITESEGLPLWDSSPWPGGDGGDGGGLTPVIKTVVNTGDVLASGQDVYVDSSSGALTLSLPPTPIIGDALRVNDANGTFSPNNLTLGRNGSLIDGASEDLICDVSGVSLNLLYTGSTVGWKVDIGGLDLISLGTGWTRAGVTWTYASVDAPSYSFTVPGDKTNLYYVGMRIKLTQITGGTKYFIITKVEYSNPDTVVTVYGGTDYVLTNEDISFPCFSPHKAPAGFPINPAKWMTTIINNSSAYTTATPTTGIWYNTGSMAGSVPIGSWNVTIRAISNAYRNFTSSTSVAGPNVYNTLSTTTNSETHQESTTFGYMQQGSGLNLGAHTGGTFLATNYTYLLNNTTKTTYYLLHRADASPEAITNLQFRGDIMATKVTLICAYL